MTDIPSIFMEKFCDLNEPTLERTAMCLKWFLLASKHCSRIMNKSRKQGPLIWSALMNFVFPEQPSDLMTMKRPIEIQPSRLTLQDCVYLYEDIANDYVMGAHRFASISRFYTLLWHLFYCLMLFMTVGCVVFGANKLYARFIAYKKKPIIDALDPQLRQEKIVSRSIRMAKVEVWRLKVCPIIKPKDFIDNDGIAVMVIKVHSKFEYIDSTVTGSLITKSRLYRPHNSHAKLKSEYKMQPVGNILKFVGIASAALPIVVIFQEPLADDSAEKLLCITDLDSGADDSSRNANKRALAKSSRAISPQRQALTSLKSSPRAGVSQPNTGRRSPANKK